MTTNDALPSRKEKARYVEDVSMSSDSDDEHSIIKQVKVTQKPRAIKYKLCMFVTLLRSHDRTKPAFSAQSMKSCTVPLGEQKGDNTLNSTCSRFSQTLYIVTAITPGFAKDIAVKKSKMLKVRT